MVMGAIVFVWWLICWRLIREIYFWDKNEYTVFYVGVVSLLMGNILFIIVDI